MKNTKFNLLTKILPPPSDNIISGSDLDKGYKHFSKGLRIILMVLVFVPLLIISLLSHNQYASLLQNEEIDQLILNLKQSQSTIEKFIAELQSVIRFVARDDRYTELLDSHELNILFNRLQNEYPEVADIEIIDSHGTQQAYAGPYALENHDYSEQLWYQEVLRQGFYISTIFSGFREIPHFVIAVSKKHPQQQEKWVLRVTVEGKALQNFVDTIGITYADDIFLVDPNYMAQTAPHKYGKPGERCVLYDLPDITSRSIKKSLAGNEMFTAELTNIQIFQKIYNEQPIFQAITKLKNTPWELVLVKEQYMYAESWRSFKIRLTTIFLSCLFISFIVIYRLSSAITNHLRESDLKREQFLIEAEQPNKLASIGRLAAGVAHEINNPLAVINQKAGLAQDFIEITDDFTHKQAMEDALDGIQSSVERCKKITHRLLGFARQAEVRTEEININEVIREVVDFLAKEASYNQIKIDFDLAPDLKKIVSDRGQLQQILINITNNAVDAIGSGGAITLRSRQIEDDTVQIQIRDNGPGMSIEVQKHIFDPFFTTKEVGKGTGLGLSIVYGLIKKLGGTIKVTSEVGKGTTFEIHLPLSQN